MSRAMDKQVIRLLSVVLLLFLLSACTGGSKQFDKYRGTDGLVVSFSENAPPEEVYEGTAFPVRLNVRNAGANDVEYERMLVTFSHDPLYIAGGRNPFPLQWVDLDAKGIQGKSLAYPAGETRSYEVPLEAAFEVKPVLGQREMPTTQLIASVCYPYTTTLSTSVCISTNSYGENARAQPCEPRDLAFTGGQGAPVAITGVEIDAFPVIDRLLGIQSVQPHFTITVTDVGKGYLVGPNDLPFESACLLKGIPKEQASAVRIRAYLLNAELECQPGEYVRLYDGEGQVRCTVPKSELSRPVYQGSQNFQSVLTVNLSYYYKASTTAELDIVRIPGAQEQELPGYGRVTGYLYEGDQIARDENGNAVTLCSHYGQHPEEAPDAIRGRISDAFECSCGQPTCLKLARNGQCFAALCPGITYCCNRQQALAVVGAPAFDAPVADPSVTIPSIGGNPDKAQINAALNAAALKYGIPPDLLKAIAFKESSWDNSQVGDGGVSYGVMQINSGPKAHPDYDIARGKQEASYNIEFGAAFLARLYAETKDWKTATRRYNGSGPMAEAYADSVMLLVRERPWSRWV